MAGGDPMGDQLPGEVEVASFNRGELRLTNLRLRYRGHGRRRRESFEMQLTSLTAAGVVRRYTVHMWILWFPVALLVLGFFGLVSMGLEAIMAIALFLALIGTPVLVVGSWIAAPVYAIRLVGGGYAWHVETPRARLREAADFVHEVSAAMATEQEGEPTRVEVPAFTARPFGR